MQVWETQGTGIGDPGYNLVMGAHGGALLRDSEFFRVFRVFRGQIFVWVRVLSGQSLQWTEFRRAHPGPSTQILCRRVNTGENAPTCFALARAKSFAGRIAVHSPVRGSFAEVIAVLLRV